MSDGGRWWSERKSVIKAMMTPFVLPKDTRRSESCTQREYNVDTLMKRIQSQIFECEDQGLPWRTPEDWDRSRELLGSGQTRRQSSVILRRMTWDYFLQEADKIIENRT